MSPSFYSTRWAQPPGVGEPLRPWPAAGFRLLLSYYLQRLGRVKNQILPKSAVWSMRCGFWDLSILFLNLFSPPESFTYLFRYSLHQKEVGLLGEMTDSKTRGRKAQGEPGAPCARKLSHNWWAVWKGHEPAGRGSHRSNLGWSEHQKKKEKQHCNALHKIRIIESTTIYACVYIYLYITCVYILYITCIFQVIHLEYVFIKYNVCVNK